MLCALLGGVVPPARAQEEKNACLRADASTAKRMTELAKTKRERYRIADPHNLKPWMDKVTADSKQTRAEVTKGLKLCRTDEQLGPRTRRSVVNRMKKRLRLLDETDEQMLMMQALGSPDPKIDPSVIRVLELNP